MKKNKLIPKRCKPCLSLSTSGIKGSKYGRWCCHFGAPANKVQAQCLQSNALRMKEQPNV